MQAPTPTQCGKNYRVAQVGDKGRNGGKTRIWHVECLLDAVEVIEKLRVFDREFFGAAGGSRGVNYKNWHLRVLQHSSQSLFGEGGV